MAARYKAQVFKNDKPPQRVAVAEGGDFTKAFFLKNEGEFKKKYDGNVKGGSEFGIGQTFVKDNPKLFKDNYFAKKEKLKNLSNEIGGKAGKGSTADKGSDFKGKSGKKQQKQQPTQPIVEIKDREVIGVRDTNASKAAERIALKDFQDKDVAEAFYKWGQPSDEKGNLVEIKKREDGKWDIDRSPERIKQAVNDYDKVRIGAINSEQYKKNEDWEAILEQNQDATLAAVRLPASIRAAGSVGKATRTGGLRFGKGYVGTLRRNYEEASKKVGLGASDQAFSTSFAGGVINPANWVWSKESDASKIEKNHLKAMKIKAEADVEEAKALKEEGIERSVKSRNARLNEIEADKKASASFLNKLSFGLVGRDSLAVSKVKAERAEAEAAVRVAKQEGKAAVESARAQRKAIAVQSGAFGARQRAQRLEQKELERLEERSAEGRPITKADKKRLEFIREFSEGTPSSFARGEDQVRSVVAPNAETIQAAKDWERRKRGSKK